MLLEHCFLFEKTMEKKSEKKENDYEKTTERQDCRRQKKQRENGTVHNFYVTQSTLFLTSLDHKPIKITSSHPIIETSSKMTNDIYQPMADFFLLECHST